MKILGWTISAIAGLLLIAFGAEVTLNWVPDQPVAQLVPRWAQPPSEFVDVAGLSLHLRDEGPRDDPMPIVLLHGTSSSLHTWDGWARALSAQRRVIRFDLPGFGLTGPTLDGNYTIENYSRVLLALLDRLGIERADLAGNSFGGYVAWVTALNHPDRVNRLVLVDSAGYAFEPKSIPLGFRLARIPALSWLVENVTPRRVIESSLRNVYGHPERVTPELVDLYFDLATRAGNRRALIERFRQSVPGKYADRVSGIRAPTLILWGGRDQLIPPELGRRFSREIPGSQLVIFADLGHVPQEEDPRATVTAAWSFLGLN